MMSSLLELGTGQTYICRRSSRQIQRNRLVCPPRRHGRDPDDSLANAKQQPVAETLDKWDDDVKVSDSGEAAGRRAVMSAPVTLCRRAYTNHPELLHHRQHVDHSPMLRDKAV